MTGQNWTELNAKNYELESERESRKTALKILYADLETAEGNIRLQANKHEAINMYGLQLWQVKKSPRAKQ